MAGADVHVNKGMSRSDCWSGRAALGGFDAIECDWRELLRWIASVGGTAASECPRG